MACTYLLRRCHPHESLPRFTGEMPWKTARGLVTEGPCWGLLSLTVPVFRCLSNINQLFPQHLQEVTFPSHVHGCGGMWAQTLRARQESVYKKGHALATPCYAAGTSALKPPACLVPAAGPLDWAACARPARWSLPGAGGTQHSLEVIESATRTARSPDPPPAEGRVCTVCLSRVSPHISERPVLT